MVLLNPWVATLNWVANDCSYIKLPSPLLRGENLKM